MFGAWPWNIKMATNRIIAWERATRRLPKCCGSSKTLRPLIETVQELGSDLKEPNEALGGSIPLSLLATVEGDEVVHAEIGAVEHGLPA